MRRSLTVFVTDDSPAARSVREVVLSWTRAGLLGRSLWVSPDGVTEPDGSGPADVRAVEVSSAGERTDDLFVLTGVHRLDAVRVVLAQLLATPAEPVAVTGLAALGQRVADLLRDALPHEDEARGAAGTGVISLNLVVPTSAATDVPRGVLRRGWDVNAVVAAEDRPDLDRGSVFVRHPGNYVGHAASALAGAGGLWAGVHEGVLDDLEVDSTTMEDDVLVCRIAVRAVLGEDLPLTAAATAIGAVGEHENAPARFLRWARDARDVDLVVTESASALLRRDPWKPAVMTEVASPVRGHRAPRVALREAVQANARTVRLGLGWLAGRGREMVEDAATGVLVGHGTDYSVRFQPATPETLEAAARQQLRHSSDRQREFMLEREAVAVGSAPPSTWEDLRRLSLSLLDGGQRPSWAGERSTEVTELLPPVAVVASPWDELLDADGRPVRSYDLDAGRDVLQRAEWRVEQLETRIDRLRSQLAEAAQAAERGEDDAQEQAIELQAARQELAQLELERERTTARREVVAAWVCRRERSLLGHVVDHTSDLHHRALRQAEAARDEALDDTPPSVEELRSAQRRLRIGWVLLAVAPFVMAGLLTWLRLANEWSWRDLAVLATVGLPLWLVAAVLINHQYYMACRRYAWNLSNALARRRRSTEEYVAARREANRLRLLQSTLLDWTDILGALAHRTWAAPAGVESDLSDETLTTLPAAVAVAQASTAESLTSWHLAQVVECLCPRGWLSTAYDEVLGLPDLEVMAPGGGVSALIDADAVEAESSARETLRRLLLDGTATASLAERAVQRVREDVRDERIQMPARTVRRSGPYSDGLVVSDDAFLSSLGGAPIPFAAAQWTANGMQRSRHLPTGGLVWRPPAAHGTTSHHDLQVQRADADVAVRVDLSRRCRPDDLGLFAPGLPWGTVDVTTPSPRPVVPQSEGPAEPWN